MILLWYRATTRLSNNVLQPWFLSPVWHCWCSCISYKNESVGMF